MYALTTRWTWVICLYAPNKNGNKPRHKCAPNWWKIIADALNNHAVDMELHNHPLDWFCVWIKHLKRFVNEWSMITMIVTDEKSRAALPDGTSCLYSNWNKVVRPDQVKVLRFSSSSWQMLQKLQPPLWPGPDVTQQRYICMWHTRQRCSLTYREWF